MEDLLDLELARGLEICAGTARLDDGARVFVGEVADGLRAAGIDAEDDHAQQAYRIGSEAQARGSGLRGSRLKGSGLKGSKAKDSKAKRRKG